MEGYTDPGVRRRMAELDAIERGIASDRRRLALGMTRSEFGRFEEAELDAMREALTSRTAPGPGQPSRAARRQAMAGGYETRPQQRPPAATRY